MPSKSPNEQAKSKKLPLSLLNAETATFECSFGRGCEGKCCQNGRPGLNDEEQAKLQKNLHKILPHLTPRARSLIEKNGLVTRRFRHGLPMAGVVDGWCVFFNQGCVLHKIGAIEGDYLKYKPMQCAIFPLLWNDAGEWYVRQWNYEGEEWNDLFCLNPKNSKVQAIDSLQAEMNLAATIDVSPNESLKKAS
jgi:Fe-S-cluster containining protein